MPNKNSIESEPSDEVKDFLKTDELFQLWKDCDMPLTMVTFGTLIYTLIQREVKKGRVEELKRLDKETKTHVYVETDGYLKDRLEELEG